MPAASKAQQIAVAIAKHNPKKLYKRNRGLLEMSNKDKDDYASTKRKNLPSHVRHKAIKSALMKRLKARLSK